MHLKLYCCALFNSSSPFQDWFKLVNWICRADLTWVYISTLLMIDIRYSFPPNFFRNLLVHVHQWLTLSTSFWITHLTDSFKKPLIHSATKQLNGCVPNHILSKLRTSFEPLKRMFYFILYTMSLCSNPDILHSIFHCHVTYQRQLCHVTDIHKSFAVASLRDSKVSIRCTFQILPGNSRPSRDFLLSLL